MPGPRNLPLSGEIPDKTDIYIRKVSKEEFIKNADTDAEYINFVLSNPSEDAIMGEAQMRYFESAMEKRVTKDDIIKRVNDPTIMRRYERAHKICVEQFNDRNYLYHQLAEKNAVENPKQPDEYIPQNLNYGDLSFNRISSSLVDTEAPDEVQMPAMESKPLRGIKKIVDEMMKANLADIFVSDPDRFLDFASSVNIFAFCNLLELDTIIGQSSIYDQELENPVNAVHFFPPSRIGLLSVNARPEDRLSKEQVDFIMQYEPLFTVMSNMAIRIRELANPKAVILPEDLDIRFTVGKCGREHYADAPAHKDGIMGVDYKKNFTKYDMDEGFAKYAENISNAEYFAKDFTYAIMDNEDIAQKGFLNADFTAYAIGASGNFEVIDKMKAIENYSKDPESVKFEYNEYGVRMFPEREAARRKAAQALKDVTAMEKSLSEIYASERNASPEFRALVKNIRECKLAAEKESKYFLPNLETLTRKMTGIHEAAHEYLTKKLSELNGKQPNTLRGKRMDFARKLLRVRGPLQEVKAADTLKDIMRKEQLGLRVILDDMEAEHPKMNDYKDRIADRLSRILAIQTIRENIKAQGANMSKEILDGFCTPEIIAASARDIKKSEDFKVIFTDFAIKKDNALFDALDDIAASRNGCFCAGNGVARIYNDFIECVKRRTAFEEQERKTEVAKADAEKKAEAKVENIANPKLMN